MKDSKTIISHVAQEISRSKKGSPTEAGRSNTATPEALIDAINQVFSLFSINYHNQFHSAFKDEQVEIQAKKLWLESLRDMPPTTVLLAAKEAIKTSEYLPTINKMLECCQRTGGLYLPDARSAYREACQAPSPKRNVQWSHPAVYYAGRKTDWFFLANNEETIAFPVFKRHYEDLCQRLNSGEELPNIQAIALEQHESKPLSKEENQQRMKQLRTDLKI